MQNQSREEREALWKERIVRFEHSGLSVKKFCEKEHIPLSTYNWWRKKLKEEAFAPGESGLCIHAASTHSAEHCLRELVVDIINPMPILRKKFHALLPYRVKPEDIPFRIDVNSILSNLVMLKDVKKPA